MYSAGTPVMLKVNVGVKLRIWAPQQLQIQKGEQRSLCNSFEWSSCLSAITFPLASYTTSLSASAHGRQDSTRSMSDNRILEIFIAVNVEKVLVIRYGLKWLLTRWGNACWLPAIRKTIIIAVMIFRKILADFDSFLFGCGFTKCDLIFVIGQ